MVAQSRERLGKCKGRAMISQVIVGRSFGPDALRATGQAFDQAWADVDDTCTTPMAKEAARLFLANAILAVATNDSRDVDALRRHGLGALARKYPRVIDLQGHAKKA